MWTTQMSEDAAFVRLEALLETIEAGRLSNRF
jgi:hypothetical protein